jgi:hypothetical protein
MRKVEHVQEQPMYLEFHVKHIIIICFQTKRINCVFYVVEVCREVAQLGRASEPA